MWRRFVLAGVPVFFIRKRSPPNPGFAITSIIRFDNHGGVWVCVTSEAQEPDLKIPKPLEVVPREMQSIGNWRATAEILLKTKGGAPSAVSSIPFPGSREKESKTSRCTVYKEPWKCLNSHIKPQCHQLEKNRLDKDGDPEFQFIPDLRATNWHVSHPSVPDSSPALLEIMHWATCFTVTDLTAVFCSIPAGEGSQPLFAFTWKRLQLMWSCLSYGFNGSPAVFSQTLKEDLNDIELPGGSVLCNV